MAFFVLAGCGPTPTPPMDLDAFNRAGPIEPVLDSDRITVARSAVGEYQIGIGDVLEVYLPQVLATMSQQVGIATNRRGYVETRVSDDGFIVLPTIGRVRATDYTTRALERVVQGLYYPAYFSTPPSISVRVLEYRTFQVRVIGAVKEPGVYELRQDEMTVSALLSKAKGVKDQGAGMIRLRPDSQDGVVREALLPVRDMDIPYVDAQLEPGMTVEVEQLPRRKITVIGLVNRPGVYDYPVDVEYNVAQGIGLAGGLVSAVDPRRASVYRVDSEGNLVAVTFDIAADQDPIFAQVMLKPGDIISVSPSVYTTMRQIVPQLFRVSMSVTGRNLVID